MISTSNVANSSSTNNPLLITITGPTASGKTSLAVAVARVLKGEIISADSRQVFRGMDIGTGKDLSDYSSPSGSVPYHLIDICDAGDEYNLYRFQNDFIAAFNSILSRQAQPILCGGTGMYIDSVLRSFPLSNAPVDPAFRRSVEHCSDDVLVARLATFVKLHNHTDTESRDRLVRALEIQEYNHHHPSDCVVFPPMRHLTFAISFPRPMLVDRIEARLRQRLDDGMVDEVARLLQQGVPAQRLERYGLEYRHITRYLNGVCSYQAMFDNLFADIRHFSKRQMTYIRHIERNGVPIHWIDGTLPLNDKVHCVLSLSDLSPCH